VRSSLLKISTVVIGGQAEESGRAVVQDVEGHRCAVTRHQARDGQHLKRRGRINDETSAQQQPVDFRYADVKLHEPEKSIDTESHILRCEIFENGEQHTVLVLHRFPFL